ncbi:MAG TPA: MFS transporter [Actinoplanes sp.]|nr:MFS transporter [Actinoplanes sp.]
MRRVLSTTFRSLEVRNYRLFAGGHLIKLIGVWMMFTAQDWLVLDLSGNSPAALGIVTALQFLPVLLLTLYGGKLADRYDKRALLIMANAAFAVTAIVFAILVAAGVVVLWHVFLFAALLGIANAIETPVRQAFVSELVKHRLLPNALALSAATFNTARIGGPALAGVAIALFDTGPVFLIATTLAVAPVFTYAAMRAAELFRPEQPATKEDTRISDGLRYVGKRQDLLLPIGLMAVVGMIGFNFPVTLAALAKINFNAGPSTFGLLTTALAVGALGGALAGSGRRAQPGVYVVIGAAITFGVFEIAVGFAPNFLVALILLVPTGFFSIYLAQAANHRVQMGVDSAYRGRVMALYVLVFLGTTPIGASLAGWWGEHFGVPSSIWAAGMVSLAAGVGALIWQLRFSGERLRVRIRPRPRIALVRPAPEAVEPSAAAVALHPEPVLEPARESVRRAA